MNVAPKPETQVPPPRWAECTSDYTTACYVHLPFCDRICPYCDFAVLLYAEGPVDRYLSALGKEIAAALRPRRPVSTVYLGGGTPSALRAEQIEDVIRALASALDFEPGSIEFTIESNPSRNVADLPRWRATGINRVSVGVQSFDAGELRRLGRTHSGEQAAAFIAAARAAGFDNVSLDLIAGAPGQTNASLRRTLEQVRACGPDHVSVYALTIEEGTPYAGWHRRDPGAFPDDDQVADLLELARDELTSAGMRQYEISNFAKPGFECAHNIGYWRQRDCVAFGMSASGYDGENRFHNLRDFEAYCRAVEAGSSPRGAVERLDVAGRMGEAAMLALRTAQGINYDDFRNRFGIDPRSAFAQALKKCSEAGLIEEDGSQARLTARGRLLANSACAEFLLPSDGPKGPWLHNRPSPW